MAGLEGWSRDMAMLFRRVVLAHARHQIPPSIHRLPVLTAAAAPRLLSSRAQKKKGKKKEAAPRNLILPELATADRLAQELRVPVESLLETAANLGEHIDGASSPLRAELLELLGMESGVSIEVRPVDLGRRPAPSDAERVKLPLRPPVVTLMGHVDHGKTSLLDAFRGSSLAAAEAGGITQAISAFTVDEGTDRAITFIDTPGHELFGAMRQRGARATDVVVLVVAVDAGVQPTTLQAIEYARDTNSPIVVAANKMDREGAQEGLQMVMRQLLEQGIVTEEQGGEVPLVGVSALKRMNLEDLREAILLQAELLELHAEPDGAAEGLVLEATTQKGLGVVSSILVQRGQLSLADYLVAGTCYGKVRAMMPTDGKGQLRHAPPSTPVRISGLKELPMTGDEFHVVDTEAKARQIAEFRLAKERLEQQAKAEAERLAIVAEQRAAGAAAKAARESGDEEKEKVKRVRAGTIIDATEEEALTGPKLVPAILRADSAGSLEAVKESLSHFPTDRVQLQVVRADVTTQLSEADINLAETVGAFIVGFNVSVSNKVRQQAEVAEVGLRLHEIIYELTDGVKEELEEAIEPIMEESVLGTGSVQELFTLTLNTKHRKEGMAKFTQVAGLRVDSGEARASAQVRVGRKTDPEDDDAELETVHEGKVVSLKHFKKEVKSVRRGQECGVVLADFAGAAAGDTLTFYEMVPRKPGLYDALDQGQ